MTEEERARMRAERTAALIQMLRCFGHEATPERLEAMGLATDPIPQHLFARAVMRATRLSSSYPPSPGEIIEAAVAIEPAEANPGQPRGKPRWYRMAIGEMARSEKPRELGQRSGMESGQALTDRVSEAARADR